MKLTKLFSALFGALALCAAAAGIYLSLSCKNAQPVLVEAPEAARQRAEMLMEAICNGDYDTAGDLLYGQPDLGLGRDATDEVGMMFWQALEESRSYTFSGGCYATEDGVAIDVELRGLDMSSVTANLKSRAQTLLEQRVAEAEDTSDIYVEGGEYREEFVMEVLRDAAAAALEEDARTAVWPLTLNFICDGEQWWIRLDDSLLAALSGGITG